MPAAGYKYETSMYVQVSSYLQQLQDGLVSVLLVLNVSVILFWVLTIKM